MVLPSGPSACPADRRPGRRTALAALLAVTVAGSLLAGSGAGPRRSLSQLVVPASSAVTAGRPAPVTVTVDGLARPGTAPRTAAKRRTETGYTLIQSAMLGGTPAGFGVWVDRAARHHTRVARATAPAVRGLRALGTDIRWRGYGRPRAAEGVVRIFEGAKGCSGDGSTVGMTWTYWSTLPSGKRYATRADVYLCPRLFAMGGWALRATVRHELGHAMGLGHTNYRYRGGYQVMNAAVRPGVVGYRAGDRRGLEVLARNTSRVAAQLPPIGQLERSRYEADGDGGRIRFTGWALLRFEQSSAVTVSLTDNGRRVMTASPTVLRPDVNRLHDPGKRRHGFEISTPWTGGQHKFCVVATSARVPSAKATIGCITWNG
jgi:hypothetical protein